MSTDRLITQLLITTSMDPSGSRDVLDHALEELDVGGAPAERHCREAGQSDMKLGYANCALPIVLEHNTPNNSIPLLWAETTGKGGAHRMRPLFYRRDRHGSLQ